ncbi:hypothetical protein NL676_022266 [Syzygium grande]|nr:hypothetical protein NL676_022266 [Syzygium grande]
MAISQRIPGFLLVLLCILQCRERQSGHKQKVQSLLETVTPDHLGFDYYTTSPYLEAVAYRHATCNPELPSPDCVTCVSSVKAKFSISALTVLWCNYFSTIAD